jgi:hypothetical protein
MNGKKEDNKRIELKLAQQRKTSQKSIVTMEEHTQSVLVADIVNDKGKQKKWRKRADKGDINCSSHFALCSLALKHPVSSFSLYQYLDNCQ